MIESQGGGGGSVCCEKKGIVYLVLGDEGCNCFLNEISHVMR